VDVNLESAGEAAGFEVNALSPVAIGGFI